MIHEKIKNLQNIEFRNFKNHFEPLETKRYSNIRVMRTVKYSLCKDEDILSLINDLLKEINYILVPMDNIVPILFSEYVSESTVGTLENPIIEYRYLKLSNNFYLGAFYSKETDTLELSIKFNIKKD